MTTKPIEPGIQFPFPPINVHDYDWNMVEWHNEPKHYQTDPVTGEVRSYNFGRPEPTVTVTIDDGVDRKVFLLTRKTPTESQ